MLESLDVIKRELLTVKRPSETVPTNLRTDTFFDVIVYEILCRGRGDRIKRLETLGAGQLRERYVDVCRMRLMPDSGVVAVTFRWSGPGQVRSLQQAELRRSGRERAGG